MGAIVTFRMDAKLKKQSEQVFKDMGLNMTSAFTIFAKAVVRQGKIPFEISSDLSYNKPSKVRSRKERKEDSNTV